MTRLFVPPGSPQPSAVPLFTPPAPRAAPPASRQPPALVTLFVPPAALRGVPDGGESPPGPDVEEVVSGEIIASEWGISVAEDLAELHAKLATAGSVQSVNGETGHVVIDKADVGLGNVDNTSDADKPVSTEQAAADALRVLKTGDTMTGPLDAQTVIVRDGLYVVQAGNVSNEIQGRTFTYADWDFDGAVQAYGGVHYLPAPTANGDAANKQYVDQRVATVNEVVISATDPIATNPNAELWYQP